ncbi:hypothetical protein [Lactococcus petauri]|uniref:hypothetical protein n=1 Tax=Lactococcus petauri TaxID=1940789 RepID=UPI0021532D1C|nr:hypothetical protein [Lactococcus petauri]MDA3736100.1 hypothetical protein [Lactococcus petauri]
MTQVGACVSYEFLLTSIYSIKFSYFLQVDLSYLYYYKIKNNPLPLQKISHHFLLLSDYIKHIRWNVAVLTFFRLIIAKLFHDKMQLATAVKALV